MSELGDRVTLLNDDFLCPVNQRGLEEGGERQKLSEILNLSKNSSTEK